jgi:hypothetical protein
MAEPVQSYGPTLTNITIGNGTVTANYHRSDGWCDVAVSILFGSTTTIAASPEVGLPVATAGLTINQLAVAVLDLTPTARYLAMHSAVAAAGTTTGSLYSVSAAGASASAANMDATTPMTWAAGDALYIAGRYRMNTRYL